MSNLYLGNKQIINDNSIQNLASSNPKPGYAFVSDGLGGVFEVCLFGEDVVFGENKITASDAAVDDEFGFSVAVGSGRIVVGASGDDSGAGSAYIFDLEGNQLNKITASDAVANDEFGCSVAVGSGKIVVGAKRDNSNAGAAYIFDLDGNELAKVTASSGAATTLFGSSVTVGSDRIVVGAPYDNVNATNAGSAYIFDLDGNELAKINPSVAVVDGLFGDSVSVGSSKIVVGVQGGNDAGSYSGSAYIFDLDGNELTKITASDADAGDTFGFSVAVGSGRIVVGADGDNTDTGAAYIFDLDGNELTKITASDGSFLDRFGSYVSVGSGKIVVGAPFADDNGSSSGSAYVFDLDGNELTKITASDAAAGDQFGASVAVGSGRIVVGASLDDTAAGSNSGSAYIYQTPLFNK